MPDNREQQAAALLQTIKRDQGGKLKIFLGAAPGVGKTYAMLNAARERQQQGTPVLVGLVETHGRTDTEYLLEGFEQLPRKAIRYHDHDLTEFDLDSALQRKPALILVDELAHTNVPGSRHRRRYQDIAELLEAGIDVYTTLNIQHLASLNDLVLQITGVPVRETVPDQFIDAAHDIVFVDLPPTALIERLQQGKVYLPEYARSALDAFFSPSNLTALRELAMREVMERVDTRLKTELDARAQGSSIVIQEKLVVLISRNSDHEYLIRSGRQIADRRRMPWMVVWVDTGRTTSQQDMARLQAAMSLARELGAQTDILRGPNTFQTVVPFIVEHRINSVLVGAGTRHRYRLWHKRLYQQLIESGLPLEVTVIAAPALALSHQRPAPVDGRWWGQPGGHGMAVLLVALATVIAVVLDRWVYNANLVLVFVLAVVVTGLKNGSRPAILASVLAFMSFNFFLTEPRYTFEVARQDELATLLFLFLIAAVCGPAASRIRRQFLLLREANRYSEAMRLLGQELAVAEDVRAVWTALAKEITRTLQSECCIVAFGEHESLALFPQPSVPLTQVDQSAVGWSQKHAAMSGRLTDTLSGSAWTLFPVSKDGYCVAVALVRFAQDIRHLPPYDRELIGAMLQQGADTWRRIQLVSDLESARMKTEVEQLRSALLSSVSHDLKSPLAAMMGAAESLRLLDKQLDEQDRRELQDTILQESRRLDSYIQNLLDMTKLGHGTLKIERDWVAATDIIGSAIARLKRYFPGAKTEYHAPAELPLLYVHPALIEQALFNILENAAKFSPAGEAIRVDVQQHDDHLQISIEDRGPGIPADRREQVFNMFYVVADGDQKKQSTGMGLAICRGMIGAHGGTVKALAGGGGRGTRFQVELPIETPTTAAENQSPQKEMS